MTQKDFKKYRINIASRIRTDGWVFDWRYPLTEGFQLYGIFVDEQPDVVQGLIALRANHAPDYQCIEIINVESAFNNKASNPNRQYAGIGEHMMAFACWMSFNERLDGYVQFTSKTTTIEFYEKTGAIHIGGGSMYFNTQTAKALVSRCNL